MYNLETYLDTYDFKILDVNKILGSYKLFGYEYEEIFKDDLTLLLKYIYSDIKLGEHKKIRLEQKDFRYQLIKLYGKCVISANDCEDELSACHIIPVKDDGDYSIDNGILLEHNLHSTFDKYAWSINPDTMKIEINPNAKVNTIKKYDGKTIDIVINPFLYINLKTHYDKFIKNM